MNELASFIPWMGSRIGEAREIEEQVIAQRAADIQRIEDAFIAQHPIVSVESYKEWIAKAADSVADPSLRVATFIAVQDSLETIRVADSTLAVKKHRADSIKQAQIEHQAKVNTERADSQAAAASRAAYASSSGSSGSASDGYCSDTTKKGRRCRNPVSDGDGTCYHH